METETPRFFLRLFKPHSPNSQRFSLSRVQESRRGMNVTRMEDLYSMGNLESFSRLTLQLTGHVDKRGSWITVAGFVVSQTSEVRLGFQINRLDGKAGVVFIRKSVKPSQPFEPGHLRTPWVEHEAGDGQRPFLYYLLGLVRDRSWARFVCCTRQGISILSILLFVNERMKERRIDRLLDSFFFIKESKH